MAAVAESAGVATFRHVIVSVVTTRPTEFVDLTALPSTVVGSLGAAFGADLTSNIQLIGEVGRMSNVMPASLQTLLSLTPVDFRVSAWYGEGGVRLSAGSGLGVQPYVETVAGVARLGMSMHGLGSAERWSGARGDRRTVLTVARRGRPKS